MPYADVGAALEASTVSWNDFAWIRNAWQGPIVVKGVHTADDARAAVEHGAAAVVVSNHGGRQLDGVAPTLRRRIIPIGSYIIATEPLPDDLVAELSPRGRAFFDTKNFLYYWHVSADRRMVFGGRASMLPTSIDRTARILYDGLLRVHPQLVGRRIDYAWGGNVGFTFEALLIAADAFKRAKTTDPKALADAIRQTNITNKMMLGAPIKFNAKGQVEGIGSACVQNLNLLPTVPLGGPATVANRDTRSMRSFTVAAG